jgi:hypothetical protein
MSLSNASGTSGRNSNKLMSKNGNPKFNRDQQQQQQTVRMQYSHGFNGNYPNMENGSNNSYNDTNYHHNDQQNTSINSKDNSNGNSNNNGVKIKAGKITSSLYGGSNNPLLAKNLPQFGSLSGNQFQYGDNFHYDSISPNEVSSKYGEAYLKYNQHSLNGSKLGNNVNPLSLTSFSHAYDQVPPDGHNSNFNRTSSLDLLCSLDMVKLAQNQSLENLSATIQPSSFPWYQSMNGNGEAPINPSDITNQSQVNNYYDTNLKTSSSLISFTDFSVSLWPSMNNLAVAAEALSSSNQNIAALAGGVETSEEKHRTLGSLTKLQSLSNVALDEYEALTSMEEEKSRENKNSSDSNGIVNSNHQPNDQAVEDQKPSQQLDGNNFDIGYSLEDSISPIIKKTSSQQSTPHPVNSSDYLSSNSANHNQFAFDQVGSTVISFIRMIVFILH